jgi:hypothetical protein
MSEHRLEVADVFCTYGDNFLALWERVSEAGLDLLEVNHLLNSTPKHFIVELLFCHNA